MDFAGLMKAFQEYENGDINFKCTRFFLVDNDEHTACIGDTEIAKK